MSFTRMMVQQNIIAHLPRSEKRVIGVYFIHQAQQSQLFFTKNRWARCVIQTRAI